MIAAEHHPREEERLEALQRYEILDEESLSAFDDLAFVVSQICGTPIAQVSFVDRERQCFRGGVGLSIEETPREVAFCAHAILQEPVLIVPDAALDPRFRDNPLVTGEPHIRFYAGARLETPEGLPLGTLCAIDRVPRDLSPGQQRALEILSRQVVSHLELRRAMRRLARAEEERGPESGPSPPVDPGLLPIIAHDLRNPIGAVAGLTELLTTDLDIMTRPEIRSVLADIALATQMAATLLDNVLTWSLFGAGVLAPAPVPVALAEVVGRALRIVEPSARRKQLEFRTDLPPLTLAADPTMLSSILQNLLTNAIKFSPTGGVIELTLRSDADGVAIDVRDHGAGMSADEVERLNRGLSVTSRRGTSGEPGCGLGQRIVRDFTHAHRGRIAYRSSPGEGTLVRLRLPRSV